MVEPVEEPQPQTAQEQVSGFQKLLAARTEHYAIDAPHEVWLIRELSGLAIGLQCKPCSWEWWRPGWERNEPEVAVADPVVPPPKAERQIWTGKERLSTNRNPAPPVVPLPEQHNGVSLGFRRRCSWCGVQLRGWQLNLCRLCKRPAIGDAGIYLSAGGPPCRHASRWNAAPDDWRR